MPSTRISLPHSQSARGIIEQRGRAVFSPTDLVGEMEPDTFVQGVKLHARLYCTMREQGPGSAHTPPVSSLLSQDTTCSASDHVLCRAVRDMSGRHWESPGKGPVNSCWSQEREKLYWG